jgi:hypothetical protein
VCVCVCARARARPHQYCVFTFARCCRTLVPDKPNLQNNTRGKVVRRAVHSSVLAHMRVKMAGGTTTFTHDWPQTLWSGRPHSAINSQEKKKMSRRLYPRVLAHGDEPCSATSLRRIGRHANTAAQTRHMRWSGKRDTGTRETTSCRYRDLGGQLDSNLKHVWAVFDCATYRLPIDRG